MSSQNCETSRQPETATQRLASLILKQDVRSFIAERRDGGVSWRLITRELYEATDGQVDVTYETLRNWHGVAA